MRKLEITIQRYRADYGWPVVVDQEETETLVHSRQEGRLRIGGHHLKEDLKAWKKGLARSFLKPEEYGQTLGEALFEDGEVRDAFNDAVTRSQDRGDNLRVFLIVEDEALKPLHWERLCARVGPGKAWDFIALDQRFPFSLYIPSLTAHAFPPIGRHELRALVVVANVPQENDYGLAHFDAEATIEGIKKALAPIACDILANVAGYPLPTLDEIGKHLTARYYSMLHVVAHGQFIKYGDEDTTGETFLYLANGQGQIEDIPAQAFLRELSRVQGRRGLPLLTFLGTCESAAPEAEQAGSLGGLAQRLVRDLSLPAVIAMTQKVTITTANTLAREFYQRLHASGEVDLALTEALVELYKRRDVTVPALYGRLGGRALFSADDRPLTHADVQAGLARLEDLLADDPATEKSGLAPVLVPSLKKLAATLQIEQAALSNERQSEWNQALAQVNAICEEVVGLNFKDLALNQTQPITYDSRCPFRGLYPFRTEDREFFFGREKLVRQLATRLVEDNFLAVLGASGSGKSSLVLAGLIPHLDAPLLYMTPGSDPVPQLAAALSALPDIDNRDQAVLVVDQFEEVFTLCTDEAQRRLFFDRLLALIEPSTKKDDPIPGDMQRFQVRVIITMRADFWGECAPYRDLVITIQRQQELIAPMDMAELRQAMELQAKKVGLRFEANLSNMILDDVRNEPGAMPLLQHLLHEMWKRRHGRWLLGSEYENLGGIQQAIAHTADEFYDNVNPQEREIVRDIFTRLTYISETSLYGDSRRDTRQRIYLAELIPANSKSDRLRKLVHSLADRRLIVTSTDQTTGKEVIEVSHEALIQYWPRLRQWLDEDRKILQLREVIRREALEWEKNSRDESYLLLRGKRSKEAIRLLKHPRVNLNQLEQVYINSTFYPTIFGRPLGTEDDVKKLLLRLHNNLNQLKEREAKFAGNAPLNLLSQIDDYEVAISLTRQVLEGEISVGKLLEAAKSFNLDQREQDYILSRPLETEDDVKKLLLRLSKNLNRLQEREAMFVGNAPVDLLNQIDDYKTAISLTKQMITGEIDAEELLQALAELILG